MRVTLGSRFGPDGAAETAGEGEDAAADPAFDAAAVTELLSGAAFVDVGFGSSPHAPSRPATIATPGITSPLACTVTATP